MKKFLLICLFGLGNIISMMHPIKLDHFKTETTIHLPLKLNEEHYNIVFNYNNHDRNRIIGHWDEIKLQNKSQYALQYKFFPHIFALPDDTLLYGEYHKLANGENVIYLSPELRNLAMHIARLKENNPALGVKKVVDFEALKKEI